MFARNGAYRLLKLDLIAAIAGVACFAILEAFAAVDWFTRRWGKGHFGLLTTL
jgi:hypothetical protein